jgi:hypothetical protein
VDGSFASAGTLDIPLATPATPYSPLRLVPLTGDAFYLAENPALLAPATATPDAVVWRFDSTGSPDTGFGTAGNITITGEVRDLSVDSAGRLYVYSGHHDSTGDNWMLTRFLPDGSADGNYGSAGTVGGAGIAETMLQRDGEQYHVLYDSLDANDVSSGQDLKSVTISADGSSGSLASMGHYLGTMPLVPPYGMLMVDNPNTVPGIGQGLMLLDAQHFQFTVAGGSTYNNLRADGDDAATAYPDGVMYFVEDFLQAKYLAQGGEDPAWKASTAYPDGQHPGTTATVDTAGGVLLGYNSAAYDPATDNGVLEYAAPATVTRLRGSAPDTAPGAIATPVLSSDGSYYRTTAPITVSHLGSGDFVPARLSFGELSVDGGANWFHGWVWVQNGSNLLVRYPVSDPAHPGQPVTATLTVGGYLSPDNPTLALGDVLTVDFNADTATVTAPVAAAADTAPAASSSGGGSADAFTLLLLLLLPAHRRRRPA